MCVRRLFLLVVETSTSRGGHVVTDVGKVLIVCRLFASALFACCSRDAEKGKVDIFKKTGSEIGKSAAAKSGGLFSAEDWQCSKWACPYNNVISRALLLLQMRQCQLGSS